MAVTPYQERVYALLLEIPKGRITSYAALSAALDSSPRAVGGALRRNPHAPHVPCHRCIAATGYLGGFKGDWNDAPSGQNQTSKLALLKSEGVEFDAQGYLKDQSLWWSDFKNISWDCNTDRSELTYDQFREAGSSTPNHYRSPTGGMAHCTVDQLTASDSPFSEPALDTLLSDTYADPESRWKAVSTRDPASDCAFVYCVKTTNIYCRPVCKARLARRANVTFYDYPWQAQAAGFRPCKRCQPDLIDLMPADQGVEAIRQAVNQSIATGTPLPRAAALAQQTGLSKWHMQRKFKETYGMTIRQFSDLSAQGVAPGAAIRLESLDLGLAGLPFVNTAATSPTSYGQHELI